MVQLDLDPTVLGVGAIGAILLLCFLCLRNVKEGNDISENTTPAVITAAVQKPKKKHKSKSKSNSASKAANSSASDLSALSNTNKIPDINEELTVKVEEPSQVQDEDISDSFVYSEETIRKAKKAKETPEQKAIRLERQKTIKTVKNTSNDDEVLIARSASPVEILPVITETVIPSAQTSHFDGWAVVEDKRKIKVKKAGDEDGSLTENASSTRLDELNTVVEESAAATTPVIDSVISQITVESRKLGLLIGPKGVTKIGLQTATSTEIVMPKVEKDFNGPVEIVVTGPADGVARAVHAMNELCSKGYCNLLADADFHEGYVAVHPRYLPDIVGKSGASIKAIQAHTGVKISTPTGYTKVSPSGETIVPSKVKISLAGSRDKVTLARNLILDLTKYYHTPITHPGIVHVELDIPSTYYNYIIGSKGSEIKHIQANYKVNVYIPNAESANTNVLVLGEEHAVAAAHKHIQKIMEKVDVQLAERAKAEAEGIALGENAKAKYAAETAAAALKHSSAANGGASRKTHDATNRTAAARAEKEEPVEDWMNEFVRSGNNSKVNLGAMLPLSAKFAPAAAPASTTTVPPPLVAVAAAGNDATTTSSAAIEIAAIDNVLPVVDNVAAAGATATAGGSSWALPAGTW